MTIFKKSVPELRQMSITECGITTLAMIFSYHGLKGTLSSLRNEVTGNRNGISMLTLKKIAEDYNFNVKAFKMIAHKLELKAPLILFWEYNHFVVLEKIKNKHFYIVDPALGRYILNEQEFCDKYSGYALQISPNEKFKTTKNSNKLHKKIVPIISEQKKYLFFMILITVVIQISMLFLPLLMRELIDNTINAKSFWSITNINLIIGCLLSIFMIQIVFYYVNDIIVITVQKNIDNNIIPKFVNHLLNVPIGFFNNRSSGDLTLRTNNLEDVRSFVLNQLVVSFLNSLTLIIIMIYMFSQSMLLTSILFIIGFFEMMIIILGSKSIQPLSNKELIYKARQNNKLSEILNAITTIKNLNEEERFYQDWKGELKKKVTATYEMGRKKAKIDSILKAMTILAPILISLFGVLQILSNEMTIGTLFGFLSLTNIFLMPFNNISESIVNLNKTRSILDFIEDVVSNKIENDEHFVSNEIKGNIELKNIYFRFDKYSPFLLKNINMNISANENIAIIGASGSGKSTLVNLITRSHVPTHGDIIVDNLNINEYSPKYFRDNIGLVTQECTIFNKNIADNITLGDEKYTQKDIFEALDAASILKEILAMPQSINTLLSENGKNISGGQRQRLVIARALIKKPKILIMDEATSSLDKKNEETIQKYIDSYGATKITTSHNPDTLKKMDKIFLLEKGTIVLSGTYKEIKDTDKFKKYLGVDI